MCKRKFEEAIDNHGGTITIYDTIGIAAINAVIEFDNSGSFSSIYTASATWIDLAVGLKWNYDIKKVSMMIFLDNLR